MDKRSSSTSGKTGVHGISDLDAAHFDARMAEIEKHLGAIEALLEDARSLDAATRRTATRMRGQDEVDALKGVLQFASERIEIFSALAGEDEGTDPATFEVEVLLARLQNEQRIAALATRVGALQQRLDDCALYTTQLVKPIALKAYEIAKPFAHRDARGTLLYPAKNFYGAGAAAAARKRLHRGATATTTPTATTQAVATKSNGTS